MRFAAWLSLLAIAVAGCGGRTPDDSPDDNDASAIDGGRLPDVREPEPGIGDSAPRDAGADSVSRDETGVRDAGSLDANRRDTEAPLDARLDRDAQADFDVRLDAVAQPDSDARTDSDGRDAFDASTGLRDGATDPHVWDGNLMEDVNSPPSDVHHDLSVESDGSHGDDVADAGLDGTMDDAAVDIAPPGVDANDGGCPFDPCDTFVFLAISPQNATISPHSTQSLTAIATFTDGSTVDATNFVTWSTSQPSVAQVSNATGTQGLVTAFITGSATVTALLPGSTLPGATASTVVTVLTSDPYAVHITPPYPSIAQGTSMGLTATAFFSDGSTQIDWTTIMLWASSAPAVATVSAEGIVTGLTAGTSTITATLGSFVATASVTVTAATLSSLSIEPATLVMPLGLTLPLRATGHFSDGTTQDLTSQALWSSSDATHASVSDAMGSKGKVTGAGLGSATITAAFGGLLTTAAIDVSSAVLQSIGILYPPGGRLMLGMDLELSAQGTYSDNSSFDVTGSVTWSSRAPAIVEAGGRFISAKGEGSTFIDAQMGAIQSTLPIEVRAGALESIAITPDPANVVRGSAALLSAVGTYTGGTTYDLTWFAVWNTADLNVAWIGPRRPGSPARVVGQNAGGTTVTASWAGRAGTAAVSVAAMATAARHR